MIFLKKFKILKNSSCFSKNVQDFVNCFMIFKNVHVFNVGHEYRRIFTIFEILFMVLKHYSFF
jgi:hypothetical protein